MRIAQLTQHVLRRPISSSVRKLLEECFDHGGNNIAGRQSVYSYPMRAPLGSEVPCELEDAGFRGVVGRTDEALMGTNDVS